MPHAFVLFALSTHISRDKGKECEKGLQMMIKKELMRENERDSFLEARDFPSRFPCPLFLSFLVVIISLSFLWRGSVVLIQECNVGLLLDAF